ncbi:MAG: asparagine synthase (glutamine-hydrolyzing) [Gammaproteobacteria bacterium]
MCGIAGIAYQNAGQPDPAELKRMCDVIRHRGPDDEGTHVSGRAAIGMRRLSIIDLASGHQPIHNEDRTLWVVLNGEIYNFRELRAGLETRGHRFYTQSDTEILVHLYEEHGERCVAYLKGMYSFALWDEPRQRLFAARDRIGEKPLYYALRNGKLVFGSEIKCLLQTDAVSKDLDLAALDAYFTFLYIPAPATIFRDIRELPAAHALVFDRDGLRIERYWTLDFCVDRSRDSEATVQAFRERFYQAVRGQLVSDVPLGALLSGGIDSSAVVAAMSEAASGRVKTFSIGYGAEGAYYDERRYARQVAERYSTEHHEIVVQPQVLEIIPELVRAFDQPFADSSAIANYYVFRETRRHVTVVLSGLGGDEVGAGYERYLALQLQRYYRALPNSLRAGLVEPLVNRIPDSKQGNRITERIKRFVRTGALPSQDAYLRYITAFDEERRGGFYSPRLSRAISLDAARAAYDQTFGRASIADLLNRALYTDLMLYLPGDLLVLTDRMSMLHSIEARAPFIDHTLVEFMATVPPEMKLKGFDKKHLLKRAFQGVLPKEILYRRKQGFTVPLTVWFRNDLGPYTRSLLCKERLEATGLFQWPSIARLLEEHMSHKENHHNRIWGLLMFMVWYELYQPNPIA